MKYLIMLLAISFCSASYGQMPNKSRVYKVSTDKDGVPRFARYEASLKTKGGMKELGDKAYLDVENECKDGVKKITDTESEATTEKPCAEIVDNVPQGFGGLAIGAFDGGTEATATLVQYNIHYGTYGSIPLYLLTTLPVAEDVSKRSVKNSLLGTNSGLINIKLADDFFTFNKDKSKGDGYGFCDFAKSPLDSNLQGGCYMNTQLGMKVVEYKDENDKSKQLGAIYTSIQFSFDFPISQVVGDKLTKAGRLAGGVGVSGYYANTDDVEHLFPKLHNSDGVKIADLDNAYASFDAGVIFTIDDEFSLEANVSIPLINDEVFDTVASIKFTWAPK